MTRFQKAAVLNVSWSDNCSWDRRLGCVLKSNNIAHWQTRGKKRLNISPTSTSPRSLASATDS